jgi:hypothetical protein
MPTETDSSKADEEALANLKAEISDLVRDSYEQGIDQGQKSAVSYVRKVVGNPTIADSMERAFALMKSGKFDVAEAMSIAKANGQMRKEGMN